ncbi:UNVERIFIED_CONTAM: Target of rapamycin complex 2 subunit mapkap1 [Gekko kuhli]
MAFLDNPTIILAHIRQSHVTSDDTGMCEMVLIDHDVDLEKFHPSSANGDSGSETQGNNGESQGYVYSQSVDITSSWDFGIRRRSNTELRTAEAQAHPCEGGQDSEVSGTQPDHSDTAKNKAESQAEARRGMVRRQG